MKLGNLTPSFRLGSVTPSRIYLGNNLVWESFTPLSLSPALWLDAADASTLYDATTGGSLVAADGLIARWQDKSGNARHAVQSTIGNRPILKTNSKNGLPAVLFDGSNDLLTCVSNTPTMTAATVFVVEMHTGFGGSNFGRIMEFGANDFNYLVDNFNGDRRYRFVSNAIDCSAVGSAPENQYRLAAITIASQNDSEIVHRVNSAVSQTSLFTAGTFLGFSNKLIQIGNRTALDRAFAGRFAEILLFPAALSDANRQSVENYLTAKWAIY